MTIKFKIFSWQSNSINSKKTLAKNIRFVGFRRKGKMSPKGVVLHDGASSLKNTISTLCANGTGTHFIILRDGTILQTGELTQNPSLTVLLHTIHLRFARKNRSEYHYRNPQSFGS